MMKKLIKTVLVLLFAQMAFAQQPYKYFPESFEKPDFSEKKTYSRATVRLVSGNWVFDQAMLAETVGRDRISSGKQAVRMQKDLSYPAILQMDFDLKKGASKVVVSYGSYYNDTSSSWQLEYSVDKGGTWIKTGETISNASSNIQQAVFEMDIKEPVRFRILKLGLGNSEKKNVANGRLCIDDIIVIPNK